METRNDITCDIIQSRIFSKQGRDNYDLIFRKTKKILKSSNEWLETDEFKGIAVYDDDGWRGNHGPKIDFDEPIEYGDFCRRLSVSTCSFPEGYFKRALERYES